MKTANSELGLADDLRELIDTVKSRWNQVSAKVMPFAVAELPWPAGLDTVGQHCLQRPMNCLGRSNVGHALETAVLNELERRRTEVGYVKTPDGLEVDFVARYLGGGEELIQVCADVSAPDTLVREVRALTAAAQDHSRAVRRLLVLDRDALTRVNAPGVEVQPAYEWLLTTSNQG